MKRNACILAALAAFSLVALLPAAEPTAQPAPSKPAEKPAQEQNYWLTTKSGIRHNSKCRYYHNSNGRPCTKDEGRACKLCGG